MHNRRINVENIETGDHMKHFLFQFRKDKHKDKNSPSVQKSNKDSLGCTVCCPF